MGRPANTEQRPRVRWGWILVSFLATAAVLAVAVILFVVLAVAGFDLDGGIP